MSWIDDAIEAGNGVLDGGSAKDMKSYLDETTDRMEYEGVPHPKRRLHVYQTRFMALVPNGFYRSPGPTNDEMRSDVKMIIQRLEDWERRVSDPLSIAGRHRIENENVNINNNVLNVENSSSSSSESSASVSINQVFDLIDSDASLTEEEKLELQSLLIDAKKKASEKNTGAFAEIGSKILEGVANATPTVVSGAINFLSSLASAYLSAA